MGYNSIRIPDAILQKFLKISPKSQFKTWSRSGWIFCADRLEIRNKITDEVSNSWNFYYSTERDEMCSLCNFNHADYNTPCGECGMVLTYSFD